MLYLSCIIYIYVAICPLLSFLLKCASVLVVNICFHIQRVQARWACPHTCYNHNCFRLPWSEPQFQLKRSCWAAPMHPRFQTSLLILMCCPSWLRKHLGCTHQASLSKLSRLTWQTHPWSDKDTKTVPFSRLTCSDLSLYLLCFFFAAPGRSCCKDQFLCRYFQLMVCRNVFKVASLFQWRQASMLGKSITERQQPGHHHTNRKAIASSLDSKREAQLVDRICLESLPGEPF